MEDVSLTRGAGANKARIPKPATKEEMKLNQNRQHAIAVGTEMPKQSPMKQASTGFPKSILKHTNGNDDQWYPAFGTSMAAGAALEEIKNTPSSS